MITIHTRNAFALRLALLANVGACTSHVDGQTYAESLNEGSPGNFFGAAQGVGLGSLLSPSNARLVRESVSVTAAAATPSQAVGVLLSATVSGGSSGNGEKVPVEKGGTALRTMAETAAVAVAAATPALTVKRLLSAKTIATGAPGEKGALKNGATPAAGEAAANAGGTSVVFHAETTGTGTVELAYITDQGCAVPNSGGTSIALAGVAGASAVVDLVYLTTARPVLANGNAAAALTDKHVGAR